MGKLKPACRVRAIGAACRRLVAVACTVALLGAATVTTAGLALAAVRGGLAFDGVDDYVTFGAAPSLASPAFTAETWFRRTGPGVATSTGFGGLAHVLPLVSKGRAETDGSNVDMNYLLGIDSVTGVLAADFEEGAAASSPGLNHPMSGRRWCRRGRGTMLWRLMTDRLCGCT